MKKSFSTLVLAVIVVIVLLAAVPATFGQAKFQEEAGILPDGTPYRMRMPANWNNILISDLDYAGTVQGKLTGRCSWPHADWSAEGSGPALPYSRRFSRPDLAARRLRSEGTYQSQRLIPSGGR